MAGEVAVEHVEAKLPFLNACIVAADAVLAKETIGVGLETGRKTG
jgi:hypothetical protein